MPTATILLGAVSMTVQTTFIREILAVCDGGELLIGTALLFWLFWTGAGGFAGNAVTRWLADSERTYFLLFPLHGLLGLAAVNAMAALPFLVRLGAGQTMPFDMQVAAIFVFTAPFAVMGGILFTCAAKALSHADSPSAGFAYSVEAFGSAVGGVIISLLLIPLFSNQTTAAAGCLAAPLYSLLRGYVRRDGAVTVGALAAAVLFIPVLLFGSHMLHYQYRGQEVLETRDTRYGRLRATAAGEQLTFYSDATFLFSIPDEETVEYEVHIPMLLAGDHTRVLLLGGGPGGMTREVLKYPGVESVDCLQLDPAVFGIVDTTAGSEWSGEKKIHRITGDGREYLETVGRRYDVIIMNMPEPLTAAANRFYTAGFFRQVRDRLDANGIFAFSAIGGENYIAPRTARYLASIRATLSRSFPSIRLLPGERVRFLASPHDGALESATWRTIEDNRRRLGIETRYVREYFLRFTMTEQRIAELAALLDDIADPIINRDTRPRAYFLRTVIQGEMEQSALIGQLGEMGKEGKVRRLLLIFTAALVLWLGIPGRSVRIRTLAAGVVVLGLSEIALSMTAILLYQSLYGILYSRIALLTGSYMAGLAIGGYAGTRFRLFGREGTSPLAGLQAGIAAVALLWLVMLYLRQYVPIRAPWFEGLFYLLTAGAGCIGGMQFPVMDRAFHAARGGAHHAFGTMYGLDLMGSAAGAVVVASLVVPVLGMSESLGWLALFNALVAAALAWTFR